MCRSVVLFVNWRRNCKILMSCLWLQLEIMYCTYVFSTCWTRPCAWCLCEPVCVILGNKGAFRIYVRIWEEIKILLFFFWLEINLGDKCLDGVLNNNHYESDILKVFFQMFMYVALIINICCLTFAHEMTVIFNFSNVCLAAAKKATVKLKFINCCYKKVTIELMCVWLLNQRIFLVHIC